MKGDLAMSRYLARPIVICALVICSLALGGCTESKNAVIVAELQGTTQELNVFEDDLVRIQFGFTKDSITLDLINQSNVAIYVEWDSSVIVDPSGQAHRVIHTGVKFAERGSTQPPTLVPPGARLTDVLVPADNITFDSRLGMWNTGQLFRKPQQLIGQSFSVYLSMRPSGQDPTSYQFDFVIRETRDRELFSR
jgi:hypothetical protein